MKIRWRAGCFLSFVSRVVNYLLISQHVQQWQEKMSLRSMDGEAVPVRKKVPRDGNTYSYLGGLPHSWLAPGIRNDRKRCHCEAWMVKQSSCEKKVPRDGNSYSCLRGLALPPSRINGGHFSWQLRDHSQRLLFSYARRLPLALSCR